MPPDCQIPPRLLFRAGLVSNGPWHGSASVAGVVSWASPLAAHGGASGSEPPVTRRVGAHRRAGPRARERARAGVHGAVAERADGRQRNGFGLPGGVELRATGRRV